MESTSLKRALNPVKNMEIFMMIIIMMRMDRIWMDQLMRILKLTPDL